LRSVTHNHGVDRDFAAFAVPLASSIKMDGCGAIYPALAAVFIAQYTGTELSMSQYLIIMLASVLGSFGTAGVPGTAVIMATVVLSARRLPLEAIAYLYAIDRVLDMMRTMTNVTGQMLVPVLVRQGDRAARSRGVRRGIEQPRHRRRREGPKSARSRTSEWKARARRHRTGRALPAT
jgi:Na+/H+-dicarboxylate symporter